MPTAPEPPPGPVSAEARALAALELCRDRGFGLEPGVLPALLHEAYTALPDGPMRARVAVELARVWVYGGESARGREFAAVAVRLADPSDQPELLVAALDAALLVHWGPDELPVRRGLVDRIAAAAAHLADTESRRTAALWQLTVGLELCDGLAVLRQLRVLDGMAGAATESDPGRPVAEFFARSRRAMYALVTGDLAGMAASVTAVDAAGVGAGIADREAVVHSLRAQLAVQLGDVEEMRSEAEAFEVFGSAEGVPSIMAQGALLWALAGDSERAAGLLHTVTGAGSARVSRDVDWLLTVTCAARVATELRQFELLPGAIELLVPYAERGIVNAGAVTFHGVVAEVLCRAALALGDTERAVEWRRLAAERYRGLGARWWLDALPVVDSVIADAESPVAEQYSEIVERIAQMRPTAGGLWLVGFEGAAVALPDLKGLHHLRELIGRAGEEITALELMARIEKRDTASELDTDAGPLLDDRAKAEYRRRLGALETELDEAGRWSDAARRDRLLLEREALLEQLADAIGLGGRNRLAAANSERARVAVRKAVAAALTRIEHHDPGLARLLRDSIRTGRLCSYRPDPARPLHWRL